MVNEGKEDVGVGPFPPNGINCKTLEKVDGCYPRIIVERQQDEVDSWVCQLGRS